MKHSTQFVLSRDYLSESYDQVSHYRGRLLVIERLTGVAFIALGLVLLRYASGLRFVPLGFVVVGVLELLSNPIRKHIWLRQRGMGKKDEQVALTFDDEGIEIVGPLTTGRIQWAGIAKIIRTPRGVLLRPAKGSFLYVPESAVGRDCVDFITSKRS